MPPISSDRRRQRRGVGSSTKSVAVVIPAYNVGGRILNLLARFDDSVSWIFVVDDRCPATTGAWVRANVVDPRVRVILNECNLGVGGATAVGFRAAFEVGAEIIVKVDGDGQHRPEWVPELVAPIARGDADMVKGNRFVNLRDCLRSMPPCRFCCNIAHSVFSKPVTGYWNLFDPANGFLAIHRKIVGHLPWGKIDNGYFFETDLLFHVGMLKAKVVEVPVDPVYADGMVSGVKLWREALPFGLKSFRNLVKRVAHSYFSRAGFGLPSVFLMLGCVAVLFPAFFGLWHLMTSEEPAMARMFTLAGLPILAGMLMLARFLHHDLSRRPSRPVHPRLCRDGPGPEGGQD